MRLAFILLIVLLTGCKENDPEKEMPGTMAKEKLQFLEERLKYFNEQVEKTSSQTKEQYTALRDFVKTERIKILQRIDSLEK
jgi:uncharacterized lipoprotein YehR (DUF1307 family)